jgi:hypothetical protein
MIILVVSCSRSRAPGTTSVPGSCDRSSSSMRSTASTRWRRGKRWGAGVAEPDRPAPAAQLVLRRSDGEHCEGSQPAGRRVLAQRRLRADCSWLWFCDTDMVFEPDTLHRMIARAVTNDLKILGALAVIVGAEGPHPTLFDPNADDDHSAVHRIGPDRRVAACRDRHRLPARSPRRAAEDVRRRPAGRRIAGSGSTSVSGEPGASGSWVRTCRSACVPAKPGSQTYVDTTLTCWASQGSAGVVAEGCRVVTPMRSNEFGRIGDENSHA